MPSAPALPPAAAKPVKPIKVKPGKPAHAGKQGQPSAVAEPPSPDPPVASATPTAPATSPAAPVSPAPAAPATTPVPVDNGRANDGRPSRRSTGSDRRGRHLNRRTASGPLRATPDRLAGDASTRGRQPASPARRASDEGRRARERRPDRQAGGGSSPVVRTVRDIIETVPAWMKLALAALGLLSLSLAGGYAVTALRARSLARQRTELLGEVGLLQRALLPAIPDELPGLRASVAYRPADGPAAGGDFYDVLRLTGDRVGFVIGDVSGHGREALERTAFMRYTLRAYLEAGLAPRAALQVAGRVIGDGLGGDFATVLLAIHDPRDGSLTYACAGHPAPIVVHGAPFDPVVAGSSPPIGIGERTGLRQTTVPLPPGTLACLYTDGLAEARTPDGLLGRERLGQLVAEPGPGASATDLLERVAVEADAVPDDMATCLLTPTASVTSGGFRSEQLELSADELSGPLPERFLDECGVPAAARADVLDEALRLSGGSGGAVLSVVFGSRRTVEVLPCNVESIEVAALSARTAPRRLSAAL
ncbi:MAG TPA: PP2C family protein-serine/threonine phosphatase [Thermoleophilaceae bacterium]|nr:PP2C family protein-serine/threonine phosphatase [Thermoleophilaceae bacterium]